MNRTTITAAAPGMDCVAKVLTDPTDPKSPKARCCRLPAYWMVLSDADTFEWQGACKTHTHTLLNELLTHKEGASLH